jgi:class 3 adenylate cyclase
MADTVAETPEPQRGETEWLLEARQAERDGEFFRAFDVAQRGLAQHKASIPLKHRAVLALARSGASRQAQELFRSLGLEGREDNDIAELEARLLKDVALASPEGPDRVRLLLAAAAKYEAAYRRTGSYYPAINVANLLLLAGEPDRAAQIAELIAEAVNPMALPTGEDLFWVRATLVEAHVIRGDLPAARKALTDALEASQGNYAWLSTAARGIRNAALARQLPTDWIREVSPPTVIHYLGHIIAAPGRPGRFPAEAEHDVAVRIREILEEQQVGFGYGSLAAGADILFAEALLARGAQLHLLLPFSLSDFVERSVKPAGTDWPERFEVCMKQAKSVRYATEDEHLGDDTLYVYNSRLAMGLAALASQHLLTSVQQIAVWDGGPARGAAGTAIDVEIWRATGRPQSIIPVTPNVPPGSSSLAPAVAKNHRRARAMLFGDLKGFSKLTDRELPRYVTGVLGAIERVRDRHRDKVLLANTWGDGLFLMFQRAHEAAQCALDLQDTLQELDFAGLGLAQPLSLRIGGHLGPVYQVEDPVLHRENFFGAHVSRAARIEPVTPPGLVYVTETFAAALELEHSEQFVCDYVGITAAAKNYGTMRMFMLRRRQSATAAPSFALAV